jgi:predicted flap endonuclease-1-like 5' DNA nuclease
LSYPSIAANSHGEQLPVEAQAIAIELNKLLQVGGVGPGIVRALREAGFATLVHVAAATPEQLTLVKGIGCATAEAIVAFLNSQSSAGSGGENAVQTYRYDETRKNIPPAGLAAQGRIEERPKVRYSYDPHLPPFLRYDSTGQEDAIPELLAAHHDLVCNHSGGGSATASGEPCFLG